MFTGIIETLGRIEKLEKEQSNLHVTIATPMAKELKVDQSVSHNGVCLTVVEQQEDSYTVTAIEETLNKTNLGTWSEGDWVNLERGMQLGARLDGHIVQGHVDLTARCTAIKEVDGSWAFTFEYDPGLSQVTIEKGSITVDGVSLTVVDSKNNGFSVAIIPYTYENTCFKTYKVGSVVNLEFDVIGKYVARLLESRS
ncbi:MAG: riboflavin synthase [Bacteroidota bacterium]